MKLDLLNDLLDDLQGFRSSKRDKVIVTVAILILWLATAAMIRYIDADSEADVALRNACASAPPFASPARLFEHFPEDTYSGRCLPEINTCGEFTVADGTTRHYPCKSGFCTMYWQRDDESCRIQLSTNDNKAMPGPEFKTAKGRWKPLN